MVVADSFVRQLSHIMQARIATRKILLQYEKMDLNVSVELDLIILVWSRN